MSRVRISTKTFPATPSIARPSGRAFLGLSLNNRVIANPTFLTAVFDWVKRNVGEFDVLLGDYLHRHNYQAFDGMEEQKAIEQTIKDGKHAVAELQQVAAQCGITGASIISGGELFGDADLPTRIARFERMYLDRCDFAALVDQTTASFLERKHPTVRLDENVRAHCTAYQIEELAMFEFLGEKGYSTFVYPGAQLPVMTHIVTGTLDGVSRVLETLALVELRLFEDSTL